ncbi:hypothetical protein HPB48_006120 [Haemaphysalis longicornis]|uniref:Uncharacterized protein n=1 Tax=Haemaphysalis longicornis TaxID=44386 RepID=A0A9J6FXS9_HAELO|nr:hypothetical protein HPB48_006120 [Haemaphysalis longicornis]
MAVFFNTADVTAVLFRDENAPGLGVSACWCYPGGLSRHVRSLPTGGDKLADYFEDVYVGRHRRNGICSAEFLPKLWSVYESALDGMPRTNNSVEAWHYGLQVIAHNFYATNLIAQTPLTILISHFLWSHSRLSEQRKVRFTELVGVPALSEERAGPKRNEAQSSGKRDHCYKGVAEAANLQQALSKNSSTLRWNRQHGYPRGFRQKHYVVSRKLYPELRTQIELFVI